MYAVHVDEAARYAALALATPARPDQARAVAILHEDLATILAGTARLVTGLSPHLPIAVDATDVGRHPVQAMLNRLAAFPSLDADGPADRDPPSVRWTGRPTGPDTAVDAFTAWKGLVVESHLARTDLEAHPGLRDAERWAVLGDVAVLAHALALTGRDLLTVASPPDALARRMRSSAAALIVESHEVTRLAAAAPTSDPGAERPAWPGVVPVARLSDLPRAVDNLAHLTRREDVSASDVLALSRMLAQLGKAASGALTAAASPAAHDPLRVAGAALEEHATALGSAVMFHRHRLASSNPGSPLVLAQGREIGASAIPRILDLMSAPDRARATARDVQRYAGAVPAVLGAMAEALTRLESSHQVFVTDTSWDAPYRWRPAGAGDLDALRDALTHAAAPVVVAAAAHPTPARPRPGRDALQAALARREAEMRPTRPSAALLPGRFAAKRQQVARR